MRVNQRNGGMTHDGSGKPAACSQLYEIWRVSLRLPVFQEPPSSTYPHSNNSPTLRSSEKIGCGCFLPAFFQFSSKNPLIWLHARPGQAGEPSREPFFYEICRGLKKGWHHHRGIWRKRNQTIDTNLSSHPHMDILQPTWWKCWAIQALLLVWRVLVATTVTFEQGKMSTSSFYVLW